MERFREYLQRRDRAPRAGFYLGLLSQIIGRWWEVIPRVS